MRELKFFNYIVCILLAIFVHIIYQAIIIPEALVIINSAEEKRQSIPRHFLIIIKDLEQEICIILFLIGLYLITYKIFHLNSKKYLFNVDFLEDIGGSKVSGEKAILELDESNRTDFEIFMKKNTSFNPHIMFITKPEIMNNWFTELFKWLENDPSFIGLSEFLNKEPHAYLKSITENIRDN